jgi:hypothetical protein
MCPVCLANAAAIAASATVGTAAWAAANGLRMRGGVLRARLRGLLKRLKERYHDNGRFE